MDQQLLPDDRHLFDECAYLRMYPDIAAALANGVERSAWDHYNVHGRYEGRRPNDVDQDFYLRTYSLAREEIADGRAETPAEHYLAFGRTRGWLPNPQAPRPENPVAMPSPFGGLWTDRPDALDVIQGKLDCGHITARQAERLKFWVRNGYVVLENAIPEAVVDRAAHDLDRAYSGEIAGLKFECHAVAPDRLIPWQPDVNPHPTKALDIHHFSSAIRHLIFADGIAEFFGLIFEAKMFASQSLGFLRGSAQEGHQDSAYVTFTMARHFAATWIALEDVTLGAGELFYLVGSHRFPDFLYHGRYKSVAEARRMVGPEGLGEEVRRHLNSLVENARARGIEKTPFAAKKGDVLVWHADLVHGGNPVSQSVTRKSIVTHYCPKHVAPMFNEWIPTKLWHHNGHCFTTSHYPGTEPQD